MALSLTLVSGAAVALDHHHHHPRLAANESADFHSDQARAQDGDRLSDCREILVDTDEGYGVTNRESRRICEKSR